MFPVSSCIIQNGSDLNRIRAFLVRLPYKHRLVDFEERMQIQSVRSNTRVWEKEGDVIALAYVDAFNNLWFEIHPDHISRELEQAVLDWGLVCIRKHNADTGEQSTLDITCDIKDSERLAFAERFGFQRENVRTLYYIRSLDGDIETFPLPRGFSIRATFGESEVEALVALHRAAFGTGNMTVEERLAIMRAPGYVPELDLIAVAPDRNLAAFCICGFEGDDPAAGLTDPIGVHPLHQKVGLGKAIVSAGLQMLRSRGARIARLGTSSENVSMQKLAECLGFVCEGEKLWFSKSVPVEVSPNPRRLRRHPLPESGRGQGG